MKNKYNNHRMYLTTRSRKMLQDYPKAVYNVELWQFLMEYYTRRDLDKAKKELMEYLINNPDRFKLTCQKTFL